MTAATFTEPNQKIPPVKSPKYSNLLKEKQITLDDLQKRNDNVNTNPDKVGAVVIIYVAD